MLAYDSPLMSTENNVDNNSHSVYDAHGRQKTYIESAMQRRERIEFLKKREWVRRVTEWVRETSAQQNYVCVSRSFIDSPSLNALSCSQSLVVRPGHTSPFRFGMLA